MASNPIIPTPEDVAVLSAYLDNALSADEHTALEQRLQYDAHLQAHLEKLRQTVDLLHTLPRLKAPRDFRLDPAVYGKPKANKIVPFSQKLIWRLSGIAVAASIVLVMGALLMSSLNDDDTSVPNNQSARNYDTAASADNEVPLTAVAFAASETPITTLEDTETMRNAGDDNEQVTLETFSSTASGEANGSGAGIEQTPTVFDTVPGMADASSMIGTPLPQEMSAASEMVGAAEDGLDAEADSEMASGAMPAPEMTAQSEPDHEMQASLEAELSEESAMLPPAQNGVFDELPPRTSDDGSRFEPNLSQILDFIRQLFKAFAPF